MTRLLNSWREALLTLAPRSLKIFILLTLKYTLEVYYNARYFWWASSALFLYLLPLPVYYITLAVGLIWLFFIACSVRSSIELKSTAYFADKLIFLRYCLVLGIGAYGLFFLISAFLRLSVSLLTLMMLAQGLGWLICAILFMLDSRHTLLCVGKSALRAFWMIIYNYPFYFVTSIFLFLAMLASYSIEYAGVHVGHIYVPWTLYFAIFILPAYTCFLANFYIKRVHEQFDVYYK